MANTLKIKRGLAAGIPQGQLAEPLFTTDTYDLYIGKGSGGNQRIQNYIASGTSSQFLKGDGSLDSTSYQTALTFSSPLVNTSGTISIPVASGSVNGYLSSTDWTTFNSKEPAITAGTNLQYYRGDKTFQTLDTAAVPENGAVYFTEPRVRSTVLTGLNLSGGGTIAATDSVLTAFGKVQNQISALVGGATYQGVWNASTNSPTLTSGTGTKGYYYVVSVAGSTNLDGITDWKVGDWAIYNGTAWDKVDNTDAVSSVNGFTGAVNLGLGNISDVTLSSPTNTQLLRFNGTSSKWENWTPTYISGNQTITLSGDVSGSGTTAITTTIGALKVTNAMLAGSIDYAKMDSATVPTWNQNTTGSAATLTTARNFTINGTAKSFDGSANVSWTAAEIGLTSYLPLAGGATMTGGYTISNANNTYGSPASTNVPNIYIYNSNDASTTAHAILTLRTNKATGGNPFISFDINTVQGYSVGIDNADADSFKIAPNWDGFSTPALRIASNATIKFPNYTTNGFIKTSGGDGSLSIDTTTYNSGSGTANYVSKYTAANTIGNSQIYDDGSKVYINTTTTNAISTSGLTAAGGSSTSFVLYNTSATAGVIGFLYGSTVAGGMAVSATDDLRFETGNAAGDAWPERARFHRTTGNFTIGYGNAPADSGFRLDVSGTTRLAGALSGTSATFSGNVLVGGTTTYNPTFAQRFLILEAGTTGDNTAMLEIIGSRTVTGTYGALEFLHQSGSNRLAIRAKRGSADNSVGMDILVTNAGTTSTALDIASTGAATFSDFVFAKGYVVREASANRGGLYPYNQVTGSGTDYSVGIFSESEIFMVSGGTTTKRMVIASGGNVLIGTTTDSGYKLRVNGTSYFDNNLTMAGGTTISIGGDTRYGVAKVYNASVGDMFGMEQVGGSQTGSGAATRMFAAYSNGNYLSLGWYTNATNFVDALKIAITSGDATFITKVTAASGFFDTSDIRLKSNIKDFDLDVSKIHAKIYEKNGKIEIGYIAQDIQGLIDSAVSKNDDGYLTLAYNQIHTAKIQMLENRIKELESKLK